MGRPAVAEFHHLICSYEKSNLFSQHTAQQRGESESLWFRDRFTQQEAQKEWSMRSPEAYNLHDKLVHAFRFAYRKDPVLLGRVSAIADGTGHADMIQDLNDLAVLGKANTEPLTAIGFDLDQLDAAADEMADLLATANGDKAEQNESKTICQSGKYRWRC